MAADEPTLGELSRQIASLTRSVDSLASRVLTVDVWTAELKHIEIRLRENEKDIVNVQAEAKTERDKREHEKREHEAQAAMLRRQVLFTLLTAFVAPILVGIVLVFVQGS